MRGITRKISRAGKTLNKSVLIQRKKTAHDPPAHTTLHILPTNLYDIDGIISENVKKYNIGVIYLVEHPQYFVKYNFNKKKLILHRASMKYYYDELGHKFGKNVSIKYVEFDKYVEYVADCRVNIKGQMIFFDPIDKINIAGYNNNYDDMLDSSAAANNHAADKNKYLVLPTPNFLLSRENLVEYHKKTDKYLFSAFYMWAKRINNIIPTVKSHDRENRMRIPDNYDEPKLPEMSSGIKDSYDRYINEAVKYVEHKFPRNPGNSGGENEAAFVYPIDRKSALKWLDEFIASKLRKFGDYQDFIIKGTNWLNHSILSSSINIGLINPSDILDRLRNSDVKSQIPMNSYEGYIRQLYWREYQRLCYIYLSEFFEKNNYFGNDGKLGESWYKGELGCPPVDDAIKDGFDTGYLHHIRRLMVMGNYMMLNGISPREGFKWFMEFSVDSYEWVMYQNVYDMVFCCTGGKTMRKPYISSSAYILKMSNYEKGEWSEKWNKLYHGFLKKHNGKMQKFRYYFGKGV